MYNFLIYPWKVYTYMKLYCMCTCILLKEICRVQNWPNSNVVELCRNSLNQLGARLDQVWWVVLSVKSILKSMVIFCLFVCFFQLLITIILCAFLFFFFSWDNYFLVCDTILLNQRIFYCVGNCYNLRETSGHPL